MALMRNTCTSVLPGIIHVSNKNVLNRLFLVHADDVMSSRLSASSQLRLAVKQTVSYHMVRRKSEPYGDNSAGMRKALA